MVSTLPSPLLAPNVHVKAVLLAFQRCPDVYDRRQTTARVRLFRARFVRYMVRIFLCVSW